MSKFGSWCLENCFSLLKKKYYITTFFSFCDVFHFFKSQNILSVSARLITSMCTNFLDDKRYVHPFHLPIFSIDQHQTKNGTTLISKVSVSSRKKKRIFEKRNKKYPIDAKSRLNLGLTLGIENFLLFSSTDIF